MLRLKQGSVAVIVAGLVCLQACASEGGMDFVHVQRPTWYYASMLFNLGYLVIMPWLTRRDSDPRIVAALPIIVNTAVSALAIYEMLQLIDGIGESPRTAALAIASGIAQAIGLLVYASAVAGLVSLLIRFTALFPTLRTARSRAGAVPLGLTAVAAVPA